MSKADLKAAMEALDVRKPLRLQVRAPSFTPPPSDLDEATQVWNPTGVENHTQVENPTPVGKATQVVAETRVAGETVVGLGTPVPAGTQVGNQTQVVNPTPVENHTPVRNPTQAGNPTPVGKPTQVHADQDGAEAVGQALMRRATEQDSSVVLEARAADGLERGYTRVPNSVLMQLASGDFTRNEIKIALLIARFTISFQRKQAPLSKSVLARRADLRDAAVLEAIAGLVKKGLVEKEQGDQNRPNMLGLVLPPDWEMLTKPRRDTEATPVANPTQVGNQTPVTFSTPAPVEKPTPAGVGNPTYFKDIRIYKNNNSLSDLPEQVRKYFDELKPAKKRESEWKAFEELQGDYPANDIADCLGLLQARGIKRGTNGDESQPCHSPMAYLAKAIAEVMNEVEASRSKARERLERERRESEIELKKRDTEAREQAEWAAKERAFTEAFPTEAQQREVLMELLRGLPFSSNSKPGWIMGVGRWYEKSITETN